MRIRIDSAIGLVFLITATLPSSFGQAPINRTVTSPGPFVAHGMPAPHDPIVLLLKGIYQPVVKPPNLALPGVTIDNTWTFTEIRTVTSVLTHEREGLRWDLPGSTSQDQAVIGRFYSPPTGPLVVYELPRGAILMQFTGGAWGTPIPDGQGGYYYQETWDLTILDATGIYAPYVGGHNHMVDRFHSLNGDFLTNPNAPGPFEEDCYCIISVPGDLPLLWWTSK